MLYEREDVKADSAGLEADQVVAWFKDAILSGSIRPGEPIVADKVAQRLGAGIPLAPEALIELEHQGGRRFPTKARPLPSWLERRDMEKIFRLSGAKLRALMRNSVTDWKTEVFNAALPRESE